MNREIKILLWVFVIILLAIVVNLSWVQIFGASKIPVSYTHLTLPTNREV